MSWMAVPRSMRNHFGCSISCGMMSGCCDVIRDLWTSSIDSSSCRKSSSLTVSAADDVNVPPKAVGRLLDLDRVSIGFKFEVWVLGLLTFTWVQMGSKARYEADGI